MNSSISLSCIVLAFLGFCIIGCGTVGKPFDEKEVTQIQIGLSKKEDIQKLFGRPFRTGIENGRVVWIYEYNTYSALSSGSSKDLIIVFDNNEAVYSHQILVSSP